MLLYVEQSLLYFLLTIYLGQTLEECPEKYMSIRVRGGVQLGHLGAASQ